MVNLLRNNLICSSLGFDDLLSIWSSSQSKTNYSPPVRQDFPKEAIQCSMNDEFFYLAGESRQGPNYMCVQSTIPSGGSFPEFG